MFNHWGTVNGIILEFKHVPFQKIKNIVIFYIKYLLCVCIFLDIKFCSRLYEIIRNLCLICHSRVIVSSKEIKRRLASSEDIKKRFCKSENPFAYAYLRFRLNRQKYWAQYFNALSIQKISHPPTIFCNFSNILREEKFPHWVFIPTIYTNVYANFLVSKTF